jgi:hypothetical protein
MREMGRRLISVFVSAFLGMGTSQRHFQKDGVDLPAQMLQRKIFVNELRRRKL